MSYYAKIDKDSKVVQVISIEKEVLDLGHWGNPNDFIKTSYNTHAGVHQLGGTPLRKNFAGVGYSYDKDRDAFISPKPYTSWTLNEDTCQWDSPISHPDDGFYNWNEDTQAWDEVSE